MDALSLRPLDAQPLLAGQGELQRFDNFPGENSFRFSSSLAFETPWAPEEPRILQVAPAQVARCRSAHEGELRDRKPFIAVPGRFGGLGQLRH